MKKFTTILFDLDGTLLDTAQDMAYALNILLRERGKKALPFSEIRPMVSHGTPALIQLGFGINNTDSGYAALRERFLAIYMQHLVRYTRPFPGMLDLLNHFTKVGLQWGIVTNKPAYLAEPLLKTLGLFNQSACIVSGDTLDKCKPHPDPIWHACKLARCHVEETLYIGDSLNDITAGNHAGATTLVALYGYIATNEDPLSWGATGSIKHPKDVLAWIATA